MPSPPILVSLETAKDHLRITATEGSSEESQIYDYLTIAEDIVQEYLDEQWDDTWDSETVPGSVKADILRLLADLWRHRGDDVTGDGSSLMDTARVRFRHCYARKGPTIA